MKDLRTMQREGREGLAKSIYDQVTYTEEGMKPKWVEGGNSLKQDEARRMANKLDLDQHTANTWKACKDAILESGLLEEKDDLDVIVQEKLKEDRERIFKEIDWYFKTTDYKEVLVSDLQNIINSDTDVTN